MKCIFFKLNLLKFLVPLFLIGCNDESFIENLGNISTATNDPTSNMGHLMVYSASPDVLYCSNGLSVSIDGINRGSISEMSYSDPKCGDNNKNVMTISLAAGSHSYSISGTGNFCKRYSGTLTIERGRCLRLEL